MSLFRFFFARILVLTVFGLGLGAQLSLAQQAPLPHDPVETPVSALRMAPLEYAKDFSASAAQDRTGQLAEPTLDAFGLPCAPKFTLAALRGAMVRIRLLSPCHSGEAVTLVQGALTLSARIDSIGSLVLDLPALSGQVALRVEFADGSTLQKSVRVSDVAEFDRVVLLAPGDTGLALHVREPARFNEQPRHIWAGNPRSLQQTLRGDGGSMRLIGGTVPPLQVYSVRRDAGTARLSLQGDITAANCARRWPASVISVVAGSAPSRRDFRLHPDCRAAGSRLLLKNALPDLKIARY